MLCKLRSASLAVCVVTAAADIDGTCGKSSDGPVLGGIDVVDLMDTYERSGTVKTPEKGTSDYSQTVGSEGTCSTSSATQTRRSLRRTPQSTCLTLVATELGGSAGMTATALACFPRALTAPAATGSTAGICIGSWDRGRSRLGRTTWIRPFPARRVTSPRSSRRKVPTIALTATMSRLTSSPSR